MDDPATSNHKKGLTDVLPYDVQLKILSHVATSNSVKDLLNLKQTCKSLHEARSQPQDAALSRALDALFREGVLDFLRLPMDEQSTRKLRVAARKGHAAAKYLCGALAKGRGQSHRHVEDAKFLQGLRPQRPEEGGLKGFRTAVVSVVWDDKNKYQLSSNLIVRLEGAKGCGRRCCRVVGSWCMVSESDQAGLCDSCFWAVEAVKLRYALQPL